MQSIGQIERVTQNRVVKFFQNKLGYDYLGDWQDSENNKNIEEDLLATWLSKQGTNSTLINKALRELNKASALGGGKNLYDANKVVYSLLRYGIKVRERSGEQTQTIWLIDWQNPEKNHFTIAEEVSVKGENKKRPDIVLYVNGIALGVIELKRSSVSISEGIRQNLDNQKKDFIRNFFTTMQMVMAGNDSQGLRYGTIETPKSHYYQWKEAPPQLGEEALASFSETEVSSLVTVSDIQVEIVRKDIKNLHLAVYPPDGHVRVAAPQKTTDDNVRLAVVSRLAWIRKQQASLAKQPRQSEREFVSGESHYFWGKRYLLEVIERHGKHELIIKNNKKMKLFINPKTSKANRELVMNEWYRQQLKARIPELLEKWQPKVGKTVSTWGVKKMKTKWGSCNIAAGRIWLNLELAKKPPECLEYILVHELIHLHERCHNDRFRARLGQVLPQWKLYKNILKSEPLGVCPRTKN